jgi:inosine-uridine nucleoside N-ribohydrolase
MPAPPASPRASRAIAALVAGMLALGTAACRPAQPSGAPPSAAAATAGAGGGPLRLVVDTDVAPDDLVALASLVRDPAVDLLAITVVGTGEAHCPGGLFVTRSLVTMLADREIPVACGNPSPLADAEEFPAEWRAGVDAGSGLDLVRPGYLPDDRLAHDLLVELARTEADAGRRLTILTLGTLTNVATAVAVDPELPAKVRLVSMLGAVDVPGNVATQPGAALAEWNAHADPTAVRRVLEAGFDWTIVPLDATNSVPLGPELFAELQSDHAAGPADLVFELWARNPYMTAGGFYLWDPLAALAVRDPAVVTLEPTHLVVDEGEGPEGGRLREDPAGSEVSVAVAADRGRFEALLLDRLRLGPPRANPFTEVGAVEITAAPGRCDAALDPPTPPAGLLRIGLTNAGSVPVNAVVFELGSVAWEDVEGYAGAYDPNASPPPVTVVTQIAADAGATSAGYGTSPAGNLGIACFTGDFADPTITLAGPFPIGD